MAPPTAQESVIELKPSGLKLSVLALLKARKPVCIWGPPGIGKSQMVRQVANSLYAADYGYTLDAAGNAYDQAGTPTADLPWLRDIRASLLDPAELMGLPHIVDGEARYARPSWFPTDGTGVLFLDELNRAPVQVLNALLQLVLDRRIGPHILPDGWRIVAACNRVQDGGGVQKMTYALKKRFTHLYGIADLDEWTTWAIDADIDPYIIGYVRYRPEHFYSYDPKTESGTDPRTWEYVSDVLKSGPPPEVELPLVAGNTGYGVAGEVLAFLRTARKCPSVDAILMNPTTAPVPGPTEASSLYAIAAALARRMDDQNAEAAIAYLERMPLEYAAFAVKDAVQRDEGIAHTGAFTRFVVSHPEIM